METRIVYYDESGDDGIIGSDSKTFTLSCIYMPSKSWQNNFNIMKNLKKELKTEFGLKFTQEIHTKNLLKDKDPYRSYNWTIEQKRKILLKFLQAICSLDIEIINVIIDKTKLIKKDYNVLENALTFSIQRIENASNGDWNYIIFADEGRIKHMITTARAIRKHNTIQSHFSNNYYNAPIANMIEDILEKESSTSYFIQVSDFLSYFVHLYYEYALPNKDLPKRISKLVSNEEIIKVMESLRQYGKLNLKASYSDPFGIVVFPK